MDSQHKKPVALALMGLIIDREKRDKALALLEGRDVHFNLGLLGRGTASSKILSWLGIGESEKAVFLCILHADKAAALVDVLDNALDFKKPGHGVAFTTPVHEGCYHKLVRFPQEADKGDSMEQAHTHDMIMVVLNRGYTEELMDTARAAGATGGTVLHARGCGLPGAEKFFGITIQPEKELVMILAPVEDSCGIMQAIADAAGPGTDVNAVSFSLGVNNVKGIGRDVPEDVSGKA